MVVAANTTLKSESKFALVYTCSTSMVNTPVALSYVKSPCPEKCDLTSLADGPV